MKLYLLRFFEICLVVVSIPLMASEDMIKSQNDIKAYRFLKLDNQLRVLLVSDLQTDQSAAALDIHIGNSSDPDDWGGLAHFLEHMLFLGTEKYSDAGAYQKFIGDHGGSHNAYTSYEHTNYFFSIPNAYFEPALDRFSRFFIDPTFDQTYVNHERDIVHSEYQARKKDENRRLWDARKKWLNPMHPASRFSVGSTYTLRDRDGERVREKLIAFYEEYYTANLMTLAVVSNQTLDQMEHWIRNKFSTIPNKNKSRLIFAMPYFQHDENARWLNTLPDKDVRSVEFVFAIPSVKQDYQAKPIGYLLNFLGHEGAGSLFSVLKEKGWALALSTGSGFMDDTNAELSVNIQLTEQGLSKIAEIGEYLFEAINLIRQEGIARWRFEEQQKLSNIAFQFQQSLKAGTLARTLAARMQLYPVEDILSGPYLARKFDQPLIKNILDTLTPENLRVHLVARELETDRVTKNYDVAYQLKAIDPDLLKRWQRVSRTKILELPPPNPFIPERLEIEDFDEVQDKPIKIALDNAINLWYQRDLEFGTPRANYYVNVMSEMANDSPKHAVLTELMVMLVNYQLNQHVYPAYLAAVNYSLYKHSRGFTIKVGGFEDKQDVLLDLIFATLKSPVFDARQFEIIKNAMLRKLQNVSKDAPSNQLGSELYRLIMRPYWTEKERIRVLAEVTLEELEQHHQKFFKQVKVNILSYGDISKAETVSRANKVAQFLKDSQFVEQVRKIRVNQLDPQTKFLRTLDLDHTDSALVYYFQGRNNTIEENAKMVLLSHLMDPGFYTQLRTKGKVGYLVHSFYMQIDNTPGLVLMVQSPTHSPKSIQVLYDTFLLEFADLLAAMDRQSFGEAKSGLLAKLNAMDTRMEEKSARYWVDLDEEQYGFDKKEKVIAQIERLALSDINTFFQHIVENQGGDLVLQAAGKSAQTRAEIELSAPYVKTGSAEIFRQTFQ